MDQERKRKVRRFYPLNKEPILELLEDNSKRMAFVISSESEPY